MPSSQNIGVVPYTHSVCRHLVRITPIDDQTDSASVCAWIPWHACREMREQTVLVQVS